MYGYHYRSFNPYFDKISLKIFLTIVTYKRRCTLINSGFRFEYLSTQATDQKNTISTDPESLA